MADDVGSITASLRGLDLKAQHSQKDINMNSLLPSEWIVYLYDKQKCKQVTKKPGSKVEDAQKVVCTLKTVNDLEYFIQLMGVRLEIADNPQGPKINMDCNNIIIMRQGIKPVWEDPKNAEGGTYTAMVPHHKGYYMWSNLLMYIIGETMCDDVYDINGLEVSFHPETNDTSKVSINGCRTCVKVWDGHKGYNAEKFGKLLPKDMQDALNGESIRYSPNREKNSFGSAKVNSSRGNGGFSDGKQGFHGNGKSHYGGRGGYNGSGSKSSRGKY
jgi:hypothetical protein